MTDLCVLEKIAVRTHELLSQGWCQGALARDANGQIVDYDAESAQSWCLTGAIYRASSELSLGMPAGMALEMHIAERVKPDVSPQQNIDTWIIEGWNDLEVNTSQVVRSLLEDVIIGLRREQAT